jgi:hypothetical protein
MGKNAQRRRRNRKVARYLRGLVPCKSMKLSTLSQEYQAEHPEVIFNRATRRGLRTPRWFRVGRA